MKINIDIVTGFLEEGKTTFIREFINSSNAQEYEKLLLLVCEQGIEEYEQESSLPTNVCVKYIEYSQLNDKLMSDLKNEYVPDYILIEYNGTWELSEVLKLKMPRDYQIRNIITISDSSRFESYMRNMTQLMWDKLLNSNRVIFNRFDKMPVRKRKEFQAVVKNINNNSQAIFENRPLTNTDVVEMIAPYRKIKPFNFMSLMLLVLFTYLVIKNIEILNIKNSYALLQKINTIFISLLIQAIPFVLLGTLLSALLGLFVSERWLLKFFSKHNGISYPLAALAGIFFPICDCGMVPICNGLLKKGIPLSKVIVFLLASQAVNPVVILSTLYAFPGQFEVAVLRIVSGVAIAIVVGVVLECCHIEFDDVKKNNSTVLALSGANRLEVEFSGSLSKLQAIFQQMCFEFLTVARYIVVGALICAVIQTIIPKTVFVAIGQYKALQLVIMLLASFVMSVCSTSNAFIARSFYPNFSLNALVGFIVAGPMLDITNLFMLTNLFKKKFVMTMALSILIISFVFFWLVGRIL